MSNKLTKLQKEALNSAPLTLGQSESNLNVFYWIGDNEKEFKTVTIDSLRDRGLLVDSDEGSHIVELPTQPTEQANECKFKDSCGHDPCSLTDCGDFEQANVFLPGGGEMNLEQPILTNPPENVNKEADKVGSEEDQFAKFFAENYDMGYSTSDDLSKELTKWFQVKLKQVTEGDKYKLYDMFGKYLNTLGYAIEFDPDGFWFEELIEDKIKEFAEISVGFNKWMQEQLTL